MRRLAVWVGLPHRWNVPMRAGIGIVVQPRRSQGGHLMSEILSIILSIFGLGFGIGVGIAAGFEIVMRLSGDGRTVILTWARTTKTTEKTGDT